MYEKTGFAIKKNRIRSVLFLLLFINFALLAYIYFYYLREISQPSSGGPPVVISEEEIRESPQRPVSIGSDNSRSFVIDYTNNQFLKDGKPFTYIAGSLHYFRLPRAYWRDRLQKYKAAGLNVVCTYVEWSSHEPSPRNYQFTGDNDLEYFIQLAIEEGLLVILRPGPYICAERDFGGLPSWLLTKYPNIHLRTNDKNYESEVKIWFDVLFSRIQKYLYGNGGPIIMVQVENEYGSYFECNMKHKIWLRDEMRKHVRDAAVLFTTDGAGRSFLKCGVIPEVYATVDFGASVNVTNSFLAMRNSTPNGPLVNSEFYPGWLSHWEEPMARVNTAIILKAMKQMLDMKASFNFYMFFGGTNFGFTNGANWADEIYQPQLTSYDYDAPLTEAGDPTQKYFQIRDLISKYYVLPDVPLPKPAPKGNYGKIQLKAVLSIFNESYIKEKTVQRSVMPKTFEEMNIKYGYMVYETIIPNNISDPAMLHVPNLRDRAIVYVNYSPAGILDRAKLIYDIPLLAHPGQPLTLLVENQGRINFGAHLKDPKGLLNVPSLNRLPLFQWKMTGLPFENISWVHELSTSMSRIHPPALYVGELVLPESALPLDTYVDLTGWGKGVIFINNFNLGRYWPSIGSQVTLYVPGCYLQPSPNKNMIVVFETEFAPENGEITFTDTPILDKIPPPAR